MASVLLVEDESTLARQVRRALEGSGHDVAVLDCGSGVLAAVEADPPDLVLLDLRLPDASGLDVLSEIRSKIGDLPVVLMSGYGDEEPGESEVDCSRTFLTKPFTLADLKAVLSA